MSTQYVCKNTKRRVLLRDHETLNGIDFLEVLDDSDFPNEERQFILAIRFINSLDRLISPPASVTELKKEHILISGGVRIKDIQAKWAYRASLFSNDLTIDLNNLVSPKALEIITSIDEPDKVLIVRTESAGDFSTYTLRLVTSQTSQKPPAGFESQLSSVDFSFKVTCPSDFDCKAQTECPPEKLTEPQIDYLAKDYASFRRLMLDRLSVIMPDWHERNPADLQIALVDLLAYAGDYLSYYQDAVATEAYLGTARKRVSVRRHARLLDYSMHNGCNARTWVCLEVEEGSGADGVELPAGTKLLTKGDDETQKMISSEDLNKVLIEQPVVFETMHKLTLYSAHNEMSFYTWSDSECCLPRGSTQATLLNEPTLSLEAGDVLIFEEVLSPTLGTKADADPNNRHAVHLKRADPIVDPLKNTALMEIEWYEEDALPFPLCLSTRVTPKSISVARGNMVLADHGRTLSGAKLVPPEVPDNVSYRPQLQHRNITFSVDYDHDKAQKKGAANAMAQDPREALPAKMRLDDGDETWTPKGDLLGSDKFAAEFVVEVESDGSVYLRFGDDLSGKKPSPGSSMSAYYRIGNGREGNIGPESIGRVVWDGEGILRVRNPIAATGGKDAETMEEVRQFAPQAFRTQQRAVTEKDYEIMAEQHAEVQKASAMFRWTGSWHTVFITIDRKGGWEVDNAFKDTIRRHLDQYRLAGYDLEINGPLFVPLDIMMTVCVQPGYFRSDVKQTLLEVFSRYDLRNGTRGFFHPDNFTFGQPVYLSRIYRYAMGVAGVASVKVDKFQRWGKVSNHEIVNSMLTPASIEIVRLDNDPNFPENGKIDFNMYGGL